MKVGDKVVTAEGTGFITYMIEDRVMVELDGRGGDCQWLFNRDVWVVS